MEFLDYVMARKSVSGSAVGGSSGGKSIFATSANGRIPKYEHGHAVSECAIRFATSASGSVN